jgi:hypothetical protein
MKNKAYKWLSEWVGNGSWHLHSVSRVRYLNLLGPISGSVDNIVFRKDLRQLLADAEVGRKLREDLRQLLADAESGRKMREGV